MFDSALLKIKRAEKHIDDLRRAFNQFVRTQEHKLCVTNDPKSGELLFEVRFNRGIPSDFALIAGDAIHNLRTALDQRHGNLLGLTAECKIEILLFLLGGHGQIMNLHVTE